MHQHQVYLLLYPQFNNLIAEGNFTQALTLFMSMPELRQFYAGEVITAGTSDNPDFIALECDQFTWLMIKLFSESTDATTLYHAILSNFQNGDVLRSHFQELINLKFEMTNPHLVAVACRLNQLRYSCRHICYLLPSPYAHPMWASGNTDVLVSSKLPRYLQQTFLQCWTKFKMGITIDDIKEDHIELLVHLGKYEEFWRETVDDTLQYKFQSIQEGKIELFLLNFLPAPQTFDTELILSPDQMEVIGPYLYQYPMGFMDINYVDTTQPFFRILVDHQGYAKFYNFVAGVTLCPKIITATSFFATPMIQAPNREEDRVILSKSL